MDFADRRKECSRRRRPRVAEAAAYSSRTGQTARRLAVSYVPESMHVPATSLLHVQFKEHHGRRRARLARRKPQRRPAVLRNFSTDASREEAAVDRISNFACSALLHRRWQSGCRAP